MAEVKPFGALRFTEDAGDIKNLVCPPYDIISEEQRVAYLERNPHNIVRLELPREGEDPYKTAGETFQSWLDKGIVARDAKPAIYIYEEEFAVFSETRKIKGFTCRVKLEEFSAGVVLPHEETLSKAKADRFDLMKATNANFSSVYSLYFDNDGSVFSIIDSLSEREPDVEFRADDGVIQRLWIIDDDKRISEIQSLMADKKLYIADGHHRYETALKYRNDPERKKTGGDDPADYIMMTLVNIENDGLVVFPTHRVVEGLNEFNPKPLLAKAGEYFDIIDCPIRGISDILADYAKRGRKAFAVYNDKRLKLFSLKDGIDIQKFLPGKSEAYCNLDVTIVHTLALELILGIDKENMANQKNLSYTRDIAEAFRKVDEGANCAVIINPTKVSEIAAVAGAGEKMPQKSTYFYPKLITGLTMNHLL